MTALQLSRRAVGVVVALMLGLTAAFAAAPTAPAGAAVPTEEPTIVSPANGAAVTSNPVLLWQPLTDVTKYRVQVSTTASFNVNAWSADVFNISATPNIDLPLGTLYWRVAGMDGNAVGPFSSTSFTRVQAEAPTLLSPADGAVLDFPAEPVILRWEPVPGAKNYKVQVDDALDFIGATEIVTDVPNWAMLTTQPVDQTFYWRVQAQGVANGVNTQFSGARRYSLEWGNDGDPLVPVLATPEQGATVSDVEFRWSPVAGAARYLIQVSPNGDWANNVVIDTEVKGTSYSPPTTLNNASYFWRVRALSVRTPSDAGPWSPDGRHFTRAWDDVPTLVSPDDNDLLVDELLLRWDPVPLASAYEVQVGTDPNFSSASTYTTCTTNHTDLTPTWYETPPAVPTSELPGACDLGRVTNSRLTYGKQGVRFYWRVRGLDMSSGNTPVAPTVLGNFSLVRSFMYLPDPDGLPQPISPSAGATVEVPTVSWTPVRGAERYEVRMNLNGDQITAFTYGTSYTPSRSLTRGDGDYAAVTWSVRALQHTAPNSSNGDYGRGPSVAGAPFEVRRVGETSLGVNPDLVSPAPGAAVVHPDFDWAPAEDPATEAPAHHYEVRLFPAGSSVYQVLTDTNNNNDLRNPWRSAFTPTMPISPGPYEWQVVAFTEGNTQISASARRAITIENLDVAVPTAPDNCSVGGACVAERSTPLMRWDPVEGAAFYRVYVALDPGFTNIRRIYRTTQNSMRPMEALPDNQAGQAYYWFARPCISETVCGRFDSAVFPTARAFRKASRPITLVSPNDGAPAGYLVTFRWQAPSDEWVGSDPNDDVEARTYRVQVSTRPDFATLLDTAEVDQLTYTPYGKTYPEGPLYWRVQARDASGNYLTLSETRTVNKSSPGLVVTSPSNGAVVNGVPVIQWNSQVYAAKYQVEYYRNGDLAWTIGNRIQTTTTELNADTMLKALPIGTYAYRVRRLDADGHPGQWTAGRTFEVVGGVPSPTAPANGATFTLPRVRLEWDPVPGAVQYRVETSATAGFATLIDNDTTVMTAWSTIKAHPSGTVYWRVRALDAQGNVLGTSSTRNYLLDLSRPTATITSATPGVASALVQWSATPVAAVGPITSFTVTPFIGSAAQTPVTVPGTVREVRVTGLVNGTTYRFKVLPRDANGVGIESGFSGNVTPRTIAPFANVDRFIDRQFRDILNRLPSSQERTTWRTRLNGSWRADQLVSSLWNSSAHADILPAIARLYSAYYLRIPDFSGMMYWANDRMRGNPSVPLAYVSQFFANSAEFRRLYGSLSNRQFVELIYENILGRPGEKEGVDFWTAQLNSGIRSRGWVMIGFSNSGEYKTRFGPEIEAALIHLELLRRAPTTSERDAMAARFRDGDTFRDVVVDVLGSPEYAARGI